MNNDNDLAVSNGLFRELHAAVLRVQDFSGMVEWLTAVFHYPLPIMSSQLPIPKPPPQMFKPITEPSENQK